MMIKKYIYVLFLFFYCISISFTNEQKIKFGYPDQFCVFISNSNEHFSYKDTVESVQNKFKKNEIYFSSQINNDDILITSDGCNLLFSKDTMKIIQITVFSDNFNISDDSIKTNFSKLADVYNNYGGNARKIYIENENNKDKINILYISKCGYKYLKNGTRVKDDKADISRILFKFDYETTICEEIIIKYE